MAKINIIKGKAKNVDMTLVKEIKEFISDNDNELSVKFMQGSVNPTFTEGVLSGGHFKVKSLLDVCGVKID